jgi:alpha-mannosidase
VNKEGLENEFFKIELDPATGTIRSIKDKRFGREVLDASGNGNLLQAFADNESAWGDGIGPFDRVEHWDLIPPHCGMDSIEVIEQGPVRAVLRVARRWRSSRFVQNIILYRGIPRIDCRMTVDWREKRTLLKAAFPVSVKADSATYEIPYAAISRSTGNTTLYEQSQYEVPALQWADLSDGKYGVSLLNDSKYGYDIKGTQMRLTLLRGPSSPDPRADEGEHRFTYSLYPHAGDWRTAGTVQRGYELNAPLSVITSQSHKGILPSRKSFLEVSPRNVVAAVVKRAEDSETWIVRLYESTGQKAQVSLKVTEIIKRAVETDLLEREIPQSPAERDGAEGAHGISVRGSEVRFDMTPYEIKTLKLEFQDMKQ